MTSFDCQKNLRDIYGAALAAVDSHEVLRGVLAMEGRRLHVGRYSYPLELFERILVVGAGKATARMALAVEEVLGERIAGGLIVVKQGHTVKLNRIEQVEASHPIPDQAGAQATQRILEMLGAADERTLVICLLSGGASALLVAPATGLTLADKQESTALLLKAGAPIHELNTVRKHLSAVKGGRLALAAYPAQVATLILSDVIGDPLDVIASGPTAADPSTFADAWAVIEKYRLTQSIPARVADYLWSGKADRAPETLKEADPSMFLTRNVVVGNIRQALAAGRAKALQLGFAVKTLSAELQGEARGAARRLAHTAIAAQPQLRAGQRLCLLSGGET
ncbi:MAG: glycerate-2-kinase family protein, partial [Sulfuricella sp.]|nr:glycerate-2-kinase family protein [Sulfuricella sp.]